MNSPKETGGAFANRLLAALPRKEYERLSPHLELVHLRQGRVLCHAGDFVRYAYFPKGGMLSMLSTSEKGKVIEVGTVGSDGVANVSLVLGSGLAPFQLIVQLAANAMRIRGDVLREEFDRGGPLRDVLLRYAHALLVQTAQSAACNGLHTVEERLCRWLLVSRDCVPTDTIHLTQEFISYMLGVPRSSVTTIAGALQRGGLIRYSRGKITILDRRGLEAASCECYRLLREGSKHFIAA